jgi:hypothetical protein
MQVWPARNPQGFDYRQFGDWPVRFREFDGVTLITKLRQASETE